MRETEKPSSREVIKGSREIVLFPQMGFITPWAIRAERLGYAKNLDEAIEAFLGEYGAILMALKRADVNILLVRNEVVTFKRMPDGSLLQKNFTAPETDDFPTIDLGDAGLHPEKVFLRDLFTNLNGEFIFVDPTNPDLKKTETMFASPLWEGGKVIHAGKSVLVSEDIWSHPLTKGHLRMLLESGYKFGVLPLVVPDKQPLGKRTFVEGHIDGHANLVLGKDGRLYLICARSYLKQGGKTSKDVRNASYNIDAEVVEVDDRKLSFLALNFVQFQNGKIVVGDDSELLKILQSIAGEENVISTEYPIIEIPETTSGGIRCMLNSATPELISVLSVQSP